MYGIFRIKSDNSVIIDKDALLLIPEIAKLSEKETKYVVLVYDWYDSPLRKMPIERRRQMAKRKVWGDIKKDVEAPEYMIKAIHAYKSICYDPVRDSADAFKQKIDFLNRKVTQEDIILKDAKEYVDQLQFFEKKLYELEDEIKRDEAIVEIKGKLKLSKLERWQRSQQEYRRIKQINE